MLGLFTYGLVSVIGWLLCGGGGWLEFYALPVATLVSAFYLLWHHRHVVRLPDRVAVDFLSGRISAYLEYPDGRVERIEGQAVGYYDGVRKLLRHSPLYYAPCLYIQV